MPQISVVIPARNEGELLPATLRSMAATPAGASFEIVVVYDGSRPPVGALDGRGLSLRVLRTAGEGVAGARNRGAALCRGPAICFCDAHLEFQPGWLGSMRDALASYDAVCPAIEAAGQPDRVGAGFAWDDSYAVRWLPVPAAPAEVPFLPGGCVLVRRDAFRSVGGFDGGLVPWGHEDAELSWALWLSGFRCGAVPGSRVAHRFRARHPYPVLLPEVRRNLLRLGCVHFGARRLARLAAWLGAGAAAVGQVQAESRPRRDALLRIRRRDDDWLCARFGLPI